MTPRRILIIDDNRDIRDLMREMLTSASRSRWSRQEMPRPASGSSKSNFPTSSAWTSCSRTPAGMSSARGSGPPPTSRWCPS